MADTKVETISRLAQWKIDNFGTSTFKKSDPFKIGIWNWQLSVERNRYMYVRLFPEQSRLSKEQAPLARFVLRLSIPGASRRFYISSVYERAIRSCEDFVWPVDCTFPGRFIIDVEFLDLKICPLNSGDPTPIWPCNGAMQQVASQSTLKCLSRMLEEAILSDVTINTSDGTLRAHKAVLSASSPVFQSMFIHDLKEKESSIIHIEDMSLESCMALLSYLYGTIQQEDFWKHLLSSPGMGHIIPIIELGKRLVTHHGIRVTVFVVSAAAAPNSSESRIVEAATTPTPTQGLLDIIQLPLVDVSGLVDPDATVFTRLCLAMRAARPGFRAALSALPVSPDALVVDLFSTEHLIIGDELGIPRFVYVATNAWHLALMLYTPTLDQLVEGEYVDQTEPFEIPGCRAVRPEDVVEPMLDRSNQQYFEYLRMAIEVPVSDGILLNTWEELEPETLAALRNDELLGRVAKVPIYPVGPLVRPYEPVGPDTGLFEWLDRQPDESVIYVSFGSGGALSADQLIELACGLELSRQRFVWVLRDPPKKSGDGSFFNPGNVSNDMLSFLPHGFLDRIKDKGRLVLGWAPQANILAHPAIGGFICHCGWNSTLESVVNGLPMIAWPLYAEQRMNATLLTEGMGLAIRPEVLPSKKTVGREEVERLVRRIMADGEGNGIREKVNEVKKSAEAALCRGGGSSYGWLCKWREDCTRRSGMLDELAIDESGREKSTL